MRIALLHKAYDQQHLERVKREMRKKGAPLIKAVWSEEHGVWLAFEGCHRIRAAKELGLKPALVDVSKGIEKAVPLSFRIVDDNGNVKGRKIKPVHIRDVAEWMEIFLPFREIVEFDE